MLFSSFRDGRRSRYNLYMEVPRVAFEAQRDKEQLLIDRGEQYTRAIQLYVRKFNRYPPDFAALENTQSFASSAAATKIDEQKNV